MPRYLSLSSIPTPLHHLIHPLRKTIPNPLFRNPTPSDHLLSLPSGDLPPNVRVQEWIDDRHHWAGVGTVDRLGGKKAKDYKHDGHGREARKRGGLKWGSKGEIGGLGRAWFMHYHILKLVADGSELLEAIA